MIGQARSAIVLLALLAGCAGEPALHDGAQRYLASQAQAATEAQGRGDLTLALALWRTVLTAAPADARATEAIAGLQRQIESETAKAVAQGERAYARNRMGDGDRWMLRALALTPGEPRALTALRRSVSDASHDRQAEKSASEYDFQETASKVVASGKATAQTDAQLERLASLHGAGDYRALIDAAPSYSGPNRDAVAQLLRSAHLALANSAAADGQSEAQLQHLDAALAVLNMNTDPLRKRRAAVAQQLSDDYYKRGVALMKSDLAAASAALERALVYDPDNLAAREKLDQVRMLEKNLQRIRGR